MNTTIVVIAVAYLAVVLLIGLWATGRTKTSGDFYMEAGKTGAIGDAMTKLFNTFAQVRLTN